VRILLVPWLASALAFTIAFICWMFVTVAIEESQPPQPIGIFRLVLFALGASLIVQFAYGGLVYLVLTRLHAWNFWTVSLAYLLPVVLFSWRVSDTTVDIMGTLPWLCFGLLVAVVTWILVPAR